MNSNNSQRSLEIECKACYSPIESADYCKLECGHEFHYECIFLIYKNNLNKKNQ